MISSEYPDAEWVLEDLGDGFVHAFVDAVDLSGVVREAEEDAGS